MGQAPGRPFARVRGLHYGWGMRRWSLLAALLLAACGESSAPPAAAPGPSGAPWQRTEERAPCDAFDALRQPFFGDLHVHTRYSADAGI